MYKRQTLVSAGTIQNSTLADRLPTGTALTISGGATYDVNNTNQTIGSLAGAGTLANSSTAGGNETFTVGNNSSTLFSGVITLSGAAELNLTKRGTGTLTLSGTNNYAGITTINEGTLSVSTIGNGGVAGNLGAATNANANLVLGGGILQYTGSTASTNRGFTLTAGTKSSIDVSTLATVLTLSGGSAVTTGALDKIGTGTLTFSGAKSYTGLTSVNGGTLAYGASNVLSTGGITVDGATSILSLGANRTDSVGTVTVSNGGSITGSGTSALTSTGSFEMQAGTVSAILAGPVLL